MRIRSLLEKTWVKISLIAIGSVLLIGLLVGGVFWWIFVPWIPDASFPKPSSATEAYQQDLIHLEKYAQYEKAFDDKTKRAAFTKKIDEIHRDLANMTPGRFELSVARAVALADNGHTNVSPLGRTRRVNHFPIRIGPFEDGEFVVQATREHVDLLGAEIISVEEFPAAKVTEALLPYFGGVERRSRFFMHLTMASPALLNGRGLTNSPDGAQLTFRLRDGKTVKRFLKGINPVDAARQPFGREVMDYRVPAGEEATWVHLMEGQQPPPYLEKPDEPYLYQFLQAQNGAYIKINSNADVGERSLTGWLETVMADLAARRPAFAVVDLRFNGGGTDATAGFAKKLPSLVEGEGPIYILTSRESFSAALGAAAQIKQFGGKRVKVVGGLVGDRMRFVANGGTLFTLPNSNIKIAAWSAWEDYADGCWDWTECFWLSPFFRVPGVGNLNPDIPIALNFSDYVLNRDAMLDAALADAASIRKALVK